MTMGPPPPRPASVWDPRDRPRHFRLGDTPPEIFLCPHCRGYSVCPEPERSGILRRLTGYRMRCSTCGAAGPLAATERDAVEEWRPHAEEAARLWGKERT